MIRRRRHVVHIVIFIVEIFILIFFIEIFVVVEIHLQVPR